MDMHGGVAAAEGHESGGGSSEAGGGASGGGGGNRWPRDETLALLKIRSDMDVAFRDSSLKGPLWDEVSRKMRELGYQRSAKKCKEKFENVYKYHKRTKDGRTSKPDGAGAKTYRFFDQLEALQSTPPPLQFPVHPPLTDATPPTTTVPLITTSTQPTPPNTNPSSVPQQSQPPSQLPSQLPPSTTSSSSTSSDKDIQRRRGSKKRKWRGFFQRLLNEVIHQQEELQQKFLQTLERRERDRLAREEAWRTQEMARINREHEVLVQERSLAVAKDNAVITFLQKVSQQHNLQIPMGNVISPPTVPQVSAMQVKVPEIPPPPSQPPPQPPKEATKIDNVGVDNLTPGSSSRWPKAEIEALIKIRTDLDVKYQDSGPKGPLWEEISATMANLGYSRNAKRCKEKWENINKYFKKVKESNKKRPVDSKTCPYFHQLDAIYKEKAKNDVVVPGFSQGYAADNSMSVPPIMARPEQQWPLPVHHHQGSAIGDDDQDNESDDDDDEEDGGGDYEVVANKQP